MKRSQILHTTAFLTICLITTSQNTQAADPAAKPDARKIDAQTLELLGLGNSKPVSDAEGMLIRGKATPRDRLTVSKSNNSGRPKPVNIDQARDDGLKGLSDYFVVRQIRRLVRKRKLGASVTLQSLAYQTRVLRRYMNKLQGR